MDLAYINGEFIPLEKATVSINDRGYTFADGIYEVICTRNGSPFLLPEHFQRLERSARGINLPLPASYQKWPAIIGEGIKKTGYAESMVYIQVTRGIMPRRHHYPEPLVPQLVMTFRQRPQYDEEMFLTGQAAITVEEIRWSRCYLKTIALLPNILMKQKAQEQGCYEAFFISDAQEVHEATAANIFLVKDTVIYTPELNNYILPGISRKYIIDRAREAGLTVVCKVCFWEELMNADEVFVTSTTVDAMPIVTIDQQQIGNGMPGPVTRTIRGLFPA
ncbi:MAG: aminotransferase class IV [Deltaproteobacteria bacterium]|nr:aminotransferase class IV [Candidatus Anaeroferrophillus wilburensis]MBN2890218.1 aminotransferase class IV [Deltaproteobacteria bacterium]